jgi:hypothetical protein
MPLSPPSNAAIASDPSDEAVGEQGQDVGQTSGRSKTKHRSSPSGSTASFITTSRGVQTIMMTSRGMQMMTIDNQQGRQWLHPGYGAMLATSPPCCPPLPVLARVALVRLKNPWPAT